MLHIFSVVKTGEFCIPRLSFTSVHLFENTLIKHFKVYDKDKNASKLYDAQMRSMQSIRNCQTENKLP